MSKDVKMHKVSRSMRIGLAAALIAVVGVGVASPADAHDRWRDDGYRGYDRGYERGYDRRDDYRPAQRNGGVTFSFGFQTPSYYVPPTRYYAPPPVYYTPPPVYYVPPRTYYAPAPDYYAPQAPFYYR